MRYCRSLFLFGCILGLAARPAAAQETILRDTFQDDTPGAAPNGPEIGTSGGSAFKHIVIDDGGGDLRLRSSDQDALGGFVYYWNPIHGAEQVAVEYDYRIESGSTPSGANAFIQELMLVPAGLNLDLWWGDDHLLRVQVYRPSGNDTLPTTFAWSADTDYHVVWMLDAAADTFALKVNGTAVFFNEPIGYNLQRISSLYAFSNYPTKGDQVMDEIIITDLDAPCASETTPPVTALTQPPELGAGCLCNPVSITGSAYDPDGTFYQYKLDYRLVGDTTWTTIGTSTTPVMAGVLGNWNTTSVSQGYYSLRLTAQNTCGMSSTATRLVFVDKIFDDLEVRYPVRSAIVGGIVCLEGTVSDDWCFEKYTAEFRPAGPGVYSPVDPAHPLYTASVVNDPFASWNTPGLGLPDGDYDLRISATTACALTATHELPVTVDNTPPTALITSPTPCDYVEGLVQVIGTATDEHLDFWVLDYTTEGGGGWTLIASGTTPVTASVLGSWNTTALTACAYTLRLRVCDQTVLDCGSPVPQCTEYLTPVTIGYCGDFDVDDDGDVDLVDFSVFQWVFTGPLP